MLEEIYSNIIERAEAFKGSDKFETLIRKSITIAVLSDHDPKPHIKNVSFKLKELLEGLTTLTNSKGKGVALKIGTETFLIIAEELQFEFDESEAFLMFHLRKLGKFRKREADLLSELTGLWKEYPEYEMAKQDFSRSLKDLMRAKFIHYRRGNILLNPSFVIRYRES